jgi:hypothetical protein
MPSSVTTAESWTVSPTFAVNVFRPCTSICGGLLARISGLLELAPSAPVSEARTIVDPVIEAKTRKGFFRLALRRQRPDQLILFGEAGALAPGR